MNNRMDLVPGVDVVEVYKAIEHGVVSSYQKIEKGVVGAFQKVEDGFVGKFLVRDGETVEEAKERLRRESQQL